MLPRARGFERINYFLTLAEWSEQKRAKEKKQLKNNPLTKSRYFVIEEKKLKQKRNHLWKTYN